MSQLFGKDGLSLEHAGDLTVTREGLWTGSCRFSLPANRFDLLPAAEGPHPYAAFLAAEKLRLVFGAGLWRVHVEYAGLGGTGDKSGDQYDLSPGTGNEPIESHPDFAASIGGTAATPQNGAIFRDPITGEVSTDDETAEFDRFKLSSVLAGTLEYIAQTNTVYTVSWTQRSAPSGGAISIVANPPGPAPNYGGSYNWLRLPVAFSKRGAAYSCSQRYLSSGKRGWSNIVY